MKRHLLILFMLLSTFLFAQELKVSIDKNPVILGEQILLQYSINAESEKFQIPNFNNFRVLSGPNPSTQSSYTFSNGKSESSTTTTYSLYLKAKKEGIYDIPPASVYSSGKKINSKSIKIRVVKGNTKQNNELSNNLFIKVETSKKAIVVGEQILVTYKLLTRVELQNTELSSLPELNGFWVKDLETSSRFKRDVINGTAYNVAIIKKSVLTAQRAGDLIIDPLELKCSIRKQRTRNNRDPFASFFGNAYNVQEEFISSKPIKIKVKELNNTPINYKGIVGDFNITSEIEKSSVKANDAINYSITITGKGNFELLKPLDINFSEDFEIYEPKINNKIFEGGMKRSIKTFEYLIIPRYKGEYSIPAVSLITYNPRSKKFEKKSTSEHKLTVNASSNNDDENTTKIQQIVKNNKKEINYISTRTNLKNIEKKNFTKNLFYIICILPLIILLILKIFNSYFTSNNSKTKNTKAVKIAKKRLKIAKKCIEMQNYDLFYEEIEKSLWGYFADKFKISSADLSKEKISDYFENSDITIETQSAFINLLSECEFARYSPDKNNNLQIDTILEKAKQIIIDVEKALK
ncbi:BatD family protein [Flavobacteriales bacterium]|nr:BatD family protein [Flavobacteriales bacterium]